MNSTTIWVCVDCLRARETPDMVDPDETTDRVPWGLWEGERVARITYGGTCEPWCRCEGCDPVESSDCVCHTDVYSRAACEGCGSTLAGSRDRYTVHTLGS